MSKHHMEDVVHRILALQEDNPPTSSIEAWTEDFIASVIMLMGAEDYLFLPKAFQEFLELAIAIAPTRTRDRAVQQAIITLQALGVIND